MNEPLQPCPFCGSRDLEVQADGRVHCRACDAWGPVVTSQSGPGWGRRAAGWEEDETLAFRVRSPEANEGLSLVLLAFTLAALAFVFTQIGELTRWRYLGAARSVVLFLLLSVLCGAVRLVLAHLEARPLLRWHGLLFLLQALLAAAAALPMALAFLLG